MRTAIAVLSTLLTLTACESAGAPAAEAAKREAASAQVAAAVVGKPAPDFTLQDQNGTPVALKSFAGQTVVLEWFNPECPFVVYAHSKGPLKDMAKSETAKGGIVWLAINSGAPGKEGNGRDKNIAARSEWSMDNRILFDESGEVGKLYGAKTTPHMYVVNPQGILAYAGALDNAPLGEVRGDALDPYTAAALEAVRAGKAADPAQTTPYGCSVKYLN